MKSEDAFSVGILGGMILLVILGALFLGVVPNGPPVDPSTETNSPIYFAWAIEHEVISTLSVVFVFILWAGGWLTFAEYLTKKAGCDH